MDRDEQIAQEVRLGQTSPTLRIYQWNKPAISLGRCQSPSALPTELLAKGWPMVQRPTGGGAVLHRLDELTYAVTVPQNLFPPNVPLHRIPGILHRQLRQELLSRRTISAQKLILVEKQRGSDPLCFSSPVCGDLLYRGKKVAGSALRAWREGILIQGSIQGLPVPYDELLDTLAFAVEESFQG